MLFPRRDIQYEFAESESFHSGMNPLSLGPVRQNRLYESIISWNQASDFFQETCVSD